MSLTVDQAWTYRFHDNLLLTYQQKGSLVSNLIPPEMIHRNVKAAIDHHERLGNVIANDVVEAFGPAKILNPAHSRRALTLISSDAAVLISDENTLRSMVDPQNGYTNTIVYALARREDKHVIDALRGSAATASVTAGSGVITYSTAALPSAHKIGSAVALPLATIIAANEGLSKSGCPTGAGERIFLYSPGQLRDILAITQASSSDFTKNQIHDRGTINGVDWEGFRWIEIPDVMAIDGTTVQGRMLALTSTTRYCVAFHKSAVGISSGKDLQTVIDPRPDLQSRPLQVRTSMMMAAVRVFEGGVMEVAALEN